MSSHIYIFMMFFPLMVIITNFIVWYYKYHNIPHIMKNEGFFLLNIMYIINETFFS